MAKSMSYGEICCYVSLALMLLCMELTLPIIVLVYSSHYNDDIHCEIKNITVSLPPPTVLSNYTGNTNTIVSMDVYTNLAQSIGPVTWMYVHGSVGVFEIIVLVTFIAILFRKIYMNHETVCTRFIFMCIMCLILLFRFAWLIVGAVLFWRDCPDISPKQYNDLYWATIIIGFVGVLFESGGSSVFGKKTK